MMERMKTLVKKKDFGYNNLGVSSDTIERIKARLPPILQAILKHKNSLPRSFSPTLVFLLWDSDVSDTDWLRLTPDEISTRRLRFVEDVNSVVNSLQSAGAEVLALSGPGVLFRDARDFYRQFYLEDYKSILIQIAAESHVPYIDIRTPFLSSDRNPTLDEWFPS